MKNQKIYTEFKELLNTRDNNKIIDFIEKKENLNYFIDKFLYFSCGFNNPTIVSYILQNHEIHGVESGIYNSIKYGHNDTILLLLDFAKNNKTEQYIFETVLYLNFIEKCISHSNTNAIPLITKYYLKDNEKFLVNLDYSLNKSLTFSYLTQEKLSFILNYEHFTFSEQITSTFSQLVIADKIDFCLTIFNNLKHLLINIDKKIIVDLVKSLIIYNKDNDCILKILNFFDLINYIEKECIDPKLLKQLQQITFKNKIEDF